MREKFNVRLIVSYVGRTSARAKRIRPVTTDKQNPKNEEQSIQYEELILRRRFRQRSLPRKMLHDLFRSLATNKGS